MFVLLSNLKIQIQILNTQKWSSVSDGFALVTESIFTVGDCIANIRIWGHSGEDERMSFLLYSLIFFDWNPPSPLRCRAGMTTSSVARQACGVMDSVILLFYWAWDGSGAHAVQSMFFLFLIETEWNLVPTLANTILNMYTDMLVVLLRFLLLYIFIIDLTLHVVPEVGNTSLMLQPTVLIK